MLSKRHFARLAAPLALLGLLATFSMGATSPGCGGAAADLEGAAPEAGGTAEERLLEAQAALATHDVEQAQYIYGQIIAQGGDVPGAAYAGKGLTDLLLLPGSQPSTTILVDHLGATSGLDANDAIFAEEGFLYWMVRGVPWTDEGEYSGIRTLIAEELPWSADRMSALRAFFTGLESHGNATADDMVALADAMGAIENDFQRALDDPDFAYLYVPGPTFHYDDLDLLVGPSELHMLTGLVAATRAAIYFVAAYEHDFTLDALVGSQEEARRQPREGWTTLDYALSFVDARLARKVRDPLRLREARTALDDSLSSFVKAIDVGLAQGSDTTLRWHEADSQYAGDLRVFIEELRNSLYSATEISGSTPKTTLNLSSFFENGRTLEADIKWFEPGSATDSAGGESNEPSTDAGWSVRDPAVQAFLVDGVFEPGFRVGADEAPEFQISDERGRKFRQAVTGEFENDVEDAYFTTQ